MNINRFNKLLIDSVKVFNKIALTIVFLILVGGFSCVLTAEKASAASATGGTITTSGAYTIHTFTTSGTFTVTAGGTFEYLVIGGGGGGGQPGNDGGGGGAGGYRSAVNGEMSGGGAAAEAPLSLSPGSYTVTVGAGGTAGVSGGDSVFSTITALGGGYGSPVTSGQSAAIGGSGGGGSSTGSSTGANGTAGQGYGGGNYVTDAGGGGGAGGLGISGNVSPYSTGGVGVASSINGTLTYRAGGGGGGTDTNGRGIGGNGGGGNGGVGNTSSPTAGTANTGGGGGAAGGTTLTTSAAGGSGIVIIRYLTSTANATTTGNAGYSYNYFYSAGTVNNQTGNTLWYGTAWGAGSGYSGTACSALPNKTNYSTVSTGYNGSVSAYVSASASTLYYFCVYAYDSTSGLYYYSPTTYSLTTSATPPPAINIYSAHTIDNVSAVIGSGTNAYGLAATGYFRYGTSNVACSSLASTTTSGSAGSLNGTYYPNAVQLTGLTASTTYYYCYQATTTQGTTYSSVTSFTTVASAGTGCDLLPSSTLASAGDKTTIAGYLLSSKFAGTRVYQATVNGWTASAFHTAANAQGATITLYKNGNNNKIFGAYNPQSWSSSSTYNAGAGAFLFSLSDGYKLTQKNYANYQTYNNGNYGPTFGGGHDIGMNNATLNTQSGDYTNAHTYEAPSSKGAFTYLDGGGGTPSAYNFLPTEIEVYKLNICTASAPTITTPTKTDIAVTTATLGGNVTSEGTASVTGRGVCVGTSANPALGGTCFSTTGTTGIFTVGATGLTQNTLYHYRAYATNSVGTSYTTDDTFTTLQGTPSVTTDAASSVLQTTATLNGTANPNGFASTGWFRYFTSDPGTCADSGGTRVPSSSGTALGSGSTGVAYNQSATGLTPGIPYWVCAIASNTNGTAVGSPVQLTTAVGTPATVTISTGESNSGSYYVTLNGSANPNNFASYGFFRLYTSDPGSCTDSGGIRYPSAQGDDISLGSGFTGQAFSYNAIGTASAPDIDPGQTYYYCAFARNAYGIVGSSSADPFSTPDGPVSACDPPTGGNHTISTSCFYTGSVGGVDAGTGTNNTATLIIGSTKTLTMNPVQQVAWGSISMQSGASINLGAGSSLRRSPVWVLDADGDGKISSTEQYIGAQPAGGVRRSTVSNTYTYFSKILAATSDSGAIYPLDCNDASQYAYRTINSLVTDADNDGYKTSAAASNPCVGDASTINGRTYYKDASNVSSWLADADKLSATTDCQDNPNGAPCAPVNSSGTNGTNPGAAAASTTQINLSWGVNSIGGAVPARTSYDVYRCGLNQSACGSPSIVNVSSATTTYNNSGITCSASPYYYRIVAKNAAGNTQSNIFSGTTSSCISAPSITAQGTNTITGTTVNLTSTINGNGAATTITYRYGTSNVACSSLPSTIFGTNSGFTGSVNDSKALTGLTANTIYYYCATANNSQGTTNGVNNNNLNSNFTTLKNDGTTCTTGSECISGNCYVDADNDRYAPSSGTKTCRASSQLAGTDCSDSQADAKPGQTTYYSTSFTHATLGAGSFDWNCNSVENHDPGLWCNTEVNMDIFGNPPCPYQSWCTGTNYDCTGACGQQTGQLGISGAIVCATSVCYGGFENEIERCN